MSLIRMGALAALVASAGTVCLPGQAEAQKRQRDVIAREEIEASAKRTGSIYEVIRGARPHFLEAPRGVRSSGIGTGAANKEGISTRRSAGDGGSSASEVAVFVDNAHVGGTDMLKSILAEQVEEVRYYDPSKAESEFGMTLGAGGVIVVKMSKGKPAEKPGTF
ncbi:MAG TPA: hypothetical protein VFU23_03480 [Gemmatimonadales bacterium]|nr:hypothetical protein [Gemmatimonadales bacterium]